MENNVVRCCGVCKFYHPAVRGVSSGLCTFWDQSIFDKGEVSAKHTVCCAFIPWRSPSLDHEENEQPGRTK